MHNQVLPRTLRQDQLQRLRIKEMVGAETLPSLTMAVQMTNGIQRRLQTALQPTNGAALDRSGQLCLRNLQLNWARTAGHGFIPKKAKRGTTIKNFKCNHKLASCKLEDSIKLQT